MVLYSFFTTTTTAKKLLVVQLNVKECHGLHVEPKFEVNLRDSRSLPRPVSARVATSGAHNQR